jgi:hypothetical protein
MTKRSSPKSDAEASEFDRQMAIGREVMEREWVVLQALALGDQYPELDADARIQMARKQARTRKAQE